MRVPIDEVVTFDCITSNPSTSEVSDADSTPTFEVFEDTTDTDIGVGGNLTKRTSKTGNYRGSFTASGANGFEAGKWYNVIASATVDGVAGKARVMHFMCVPAEVSPGVPQVAAVAPTSSLTFFAPYSVQNTFVFRLAKADGSGPATSSDWTPASGDVKITKHTGSAPGATANVTNLPVYLSDNLWYITLTAAELTTARMASVAINDAAVQPTILNIATINGAGSGSLIDYFVSDVERLSGGTLTETAGGRIAVNFSSWFGSGAATSRNLETQHALMDGLIVAKGTIGSTGNSTTALHLTGLPFGDDEINDLLLVVRDVSASEYHPRWIADWADTGDLATVATLPFTPENAVDTYTIFAIRRDVTGSGGLDAAGVRSAIGMASANMDTQLSAIQSTADDVEADTQDIQSRLPVALVSGRIDSSVGAMAANVLTATAIATDAITAAKIAADAIGASELAADAIAEIQSGLATAASIAALNNLSAAEVNAEVDDALVEIHLDHLLAATYDPASKPGAADALLNELVESDGGVSRYTANALEQAPSGGASAADIADAVWEEAIADHSGTAGSTAEALNAAGSAGDPWVTALPGAYGAGSAGKIVGDNLNAAVSSRSSHSAADVWAVGTRVLTAATNITSTGGTTVPQTGDSFARLGAPANASVSADIAAVKVDTATTLVDTNELQTDWTNGGRLDNILDSRASQTSVDTIDDLIDTEIAAIQAAIAALPTRAQITGGNYALDTDANGRIRIVDGTGTGELDTLSGTVLLRAATESQIDAIETAVNALNDISIADVLQTQLTESYAANGVAPTLTQAILAIHQALMDFSISGTTWQVKRLDSSTNAYAMTLNDATNPTAVERV